MKEIVGLRLIFKDENVGNVDLTADWVKWLWTSGQLNVTVIEFSTTALTVLSRIQYARLISAIPQNNAKVTIFNYNGGVANETIVNVIEDSIQYKHETETEKLLGSPLINEDWDVVGIHTGSWESTNESATKISKAINIQSILTEFAKYVLKMLNGRTENEMWQERINAIPLIRFQHIGGGGYGQVYKVKLKTELNELAVKIVQGVGKLDDYEAQVRALEKEYAIVSRLDNHPRIVQFLAIVCDVTKVRIMIVMEYLERGSLADRLKDQNSLSKYSVLKYIVQILEGVDFLHQRKIYHSDIKPANILFNKDDEVKLCDFGIAVGIECLTESSATASHMKGDFHYMPPERLDNASRSAANYIWSIGATFVEMISGQPINHLDNITLFFINVSKYKISINGMPYNKFLQKLSEDDYKKKIISRTLCIESNRANCQEL